MTATLCTSLSSSSSPDCPPPLLPTNPLIPLDLHIKSLLSSSTSPQSIQALEDIYTQLLSLVGKIHAHLPSPHHSSTQGEPNKDITCLPNPTSKDAVPILLNAIHDQYRMLDKSRMDLKVERGHVSTLRDENNTLKQKLVHFASITEQEEEAITNKFLVRIQELQKEKSSIIEQVEREEEYITNQLQRKLAKLQREKIDMENQLEQEQEAIVNRLQKQLELARSSSHSVSSSSLDSNYNTSPSMDSFSPLRHRTSSQNSDPNISLVPPPATLVDIMRADLIGLKHRIREFEQENESRAEQLRKWRDELLTFRQRSGVPVDDLFAVSLEPLFMTPADRSRRVTKS